MYQSIRVWRDLEDGHPYQPGEAFPHDGREVSPERLQALESGKNAANLPMIRKVPETAHTEEEPESEPVKEPVKRKTTGGARKRKQ